MPAGRPTLYRPEHCQKIIEYFSIPPYKYNKISKTFEANDPLFLSAFARSIGVTHDSLLEWAKVHPEFSLALKQAKELQEQFFVTNAVKGYYAQPMSIFALKNMCGWRDKTEIEHSGYIEGKEEKAEIKKTVKEFMDSIGAK